MTGSPPHRRLLATPIVAHDSVVSPSQAIARAIEGVAVLDASDTGAIGFATAKAIALLEKYFGTSARASLPPALLKWAKTTKGLMRDSRPCWSTRQERNELCIRLTGLVDGAFQFLLEEKSDDASRLMALGLTPREAEVLLWIARGKRSWEIASILCCRPATVSKHIQRILTKLGVETRTAAAAIAVECGI